ncbi:MAG: DUF72 domain-containing protein [Verrucomicrobiota bacterium]
MASVSFSYFLGCPAWSTPEWRGTFLPNGTPQAAFLREYSKVFNAVEGNSFFYALPKLDIIERWASESAKGFEFCMKVPRDISHASRLGGNIGIYEQLITRLRILKEANRLGPTFLQLHHSFGPIRLGELDRFIEAWPNDLPLAVEVRHKSFFESGSAESELKHLLEGHHVDRVVFDSRALFQKPPSDPFEEKSQSRKPNLPVRWQATGQRPFVRFVGRNDPEQVDPWQTELAKVVADWILSGKKPYVFMHAPDDTFAPSLCARFHDRVREYLPKLPKITMPYLETQLDLF